MSELRGVTVRERRVTVKLSEPEDMFYSDAEIVELFDGDPETLVIPLLRRAQAAEALVDKLPQTADGVPVVPGMTVWWVRNDEVWHGIVAGATSIVVWVKPDKGDLAEAWQPGGCYSTREAAEAARKEPPS